LDDVGQQLGPVRQVAHVAVVLPRHHQQVDRGLRAEVLEGDHLFVLVDALGGDLAGDDLAEDALRITESGSGGVHVEKSTGAVRITALWGISSRYEKFQSS